VVVKSECMWNYNGKPFKSSWSLVVKIYCRRLFFGYNKIKIMLCVSRKEVVMREKKKDVIYQYYVWGVCVCLKVR
jgi:hypothetical protein